MMAQHRHRHEHEDLDPAVIAARLVQLTNEDVLDWSGATITTFGRLRVHLEQCFSWSLNVSVMQDDGFQLGLGLRFTRAQAASVAQAMRAQGRRARERRAKEKADAKERARAVVRARRAAARRARRQGRIWFGPGPGAVTITRVKYHNREVARERDEREEQLKVLALRQLMEGRIDVARAGRVMKATSVKQGRMGAEAMGQLCAGSATGPDQAGNNRKPRAASIEAGEVSEVPKGTNENRKAG